MGIMRASTRCADDKLLRSVGRRLLLAFRRGDPRGPLASHDLSNSAAHPIIWLPKVVLLGPHAPTGTETGGRNMTHTTAGRGVANAHTLQHDPLQCVTHCALPILSRLAQPIYPEVPWMAMRWGAVQSWIHRRTVRAMRTWQPPRGEAPWPLIPLGIASRRMGLRLLIVRHHPTNIVGALCGAQRTMRSFSATYPRRPQALV